jgi:predicted signal transduction protein with EAL and GGDEF domain
MVHSLVTLAHNLNMQVIVEGIETPEQLSMIRALGGNQVQGFLLGRPTADPTLRIEECNQISRQAGSSDASTSATLRKNAQSTTTGLHGEKVVPRNVKAG